MSGNTQQTQAEPGAFHAVLTPHRSLGPSGFLVLMIALGAMSFVTGIVFLVAGAWPVLGFFGAGRPARLHRLQAQLPLGTPVRDHRRDAGAIHAGPACIPRAAQEQFDCNPYWARVNLREWPDGRTVLSVVAQGKELAFGRFLTDDERRDLASALREALLAARGGVRI